MRALPKTTTFGPAYVAGLDRDRITGQMRDVLELMMDGEWRTLRQISQEIEAPEPSCSAQLRHLRKEKFGRYQVRKRRHELCPGLWLYRLLPPLPPGSNDQLAMFAELAFRGETP